MRQRGSKSGQAVEILSPRPQAKCLSILFGLEDRQLWQTVPSDQGTREEGEGMDEGEGRITSNVTASTPFHRSNIS